jgi:hypothetical protein
MFIFIFKIHVEVSRYYARQGYLGILFTKITNQLVNVCKDYLLEMASTVKNNSEQYFWPTILKEIEQDLNTLEKLNSEAQSFEQIKSYLNGLKQDHSNNSNNNNNNNNNNAIQSSTSRLTKNTNQNDITEIIIKNNQMNDTFLNRLKACLIVQAKYKEAVRNLRDSLGGNQALNGFQVALQQQPQSSLSKTTTTTHIEQLNFKETSNSSFTKNMMMMMNNTSARSNGILMSDEETIFSHIDVFCARIKNVLEEIISFAQFQTLYKQSNTLPRPKRDDFARGTVINGRFVTSKINDNNSSDEDDDNNSNNDDNEGISDQEKADESKKNKDKSAVTQSNSNKSSSKKKSRKKLLTSKTLSIKSDTTQLEEDYEIGEGDEESDDEIPIDRDEDLIDANNSLTPNQKLIKTAQRLFETEKTIEEDAKRIMNKTKTLTIEDLKLIS